MAYKKDLDYTPMIEKAAEAGDWATAAALEASRNEKIDGEGMDKAMKTHRWSSYSGTEAYKPMLQEGGESLDWSIALQSLMKNGASADEVGAALQNRVGKALSDPELAQYAYDDVYFESKKYIDQYKKKAEFEGTYKTKQAGIEEKYGAKQAGIEEKYSAKQAALEAAIGQKQGSFDALLDSLIDRPEFSYDAMSDPSYQAYATQYSNQGKRAMQDTLGEVAGMTGGLPSTAATAAAQQANNQYMSELSGRLPQLEQMAYGRYQDEFSNDRAALGLLQGSLSQYKADAQTSWSNQQTEAQTAWGNQQSEAQTLWGNHQSEAQTAWDQQQTQWSNQQSEAQMAWNQQQTQWSNQQTQAQNDWARQQAELQNAQNAESLAFAQAQELLARGFSSAEIASALGISQGQADQYAGRIQSGQQLDLEAAQRALSLAGMGGSSSSGRSSSSSGGGSGGGNSSGTKKEEQTASGDEWDDGDDDGAKSGATAGTLGNLAVNVAKAAFPVKVPGMPTGTPQSSGAQQKVTGISGNAVGNTTNGGVDWIAVPGYGRLSTTEVLAMVERGALLEVYDPKTKTVKYEKAKAKGGGTR